MQIAKWGNSLAVRIPADVARQLGVKVGDEIDVRVAADGALEIVTGHERRRRAMAAIKRLSRPLPPGYRFDRAELYDR